MILLSGLCAVTLGVIAIEFAVKPQNKQEDQT